MSGQCIGVLGWGCVRQGSAINGRNIRDSIITGAKARQGRIKHILCSLIWLHCFDGLLLILQRLSFLLCHRNPKTLQGTLHWKKQQQYNVLSSYPHSKTASSSQKQAHTATVSAHTHTPPLDVTYTVNLGLLGHRPAFQNTHTGTFYINGKQVSALGLLSAAEKRVASIMGGGASKSSKVTCCTCQYMYLQQTKTITTPSEGHPVSHLMSHPC